MLAKVNSSICSPQKQYVNLFSLFKKFGFQSRISIEILLDSVNADQGLKKEAMSIAFIVI